MMIEEHGHADSIQAVASSGNTVVVEGLAEAQRLVVVVHRIAKREVAGANRAPRHPISGAIWVLCRRPGPPPDPTAPIAKQGGPARRPVDALCITTPSLTPVVFH